MREHEAFLDAIRANPDDEAPRLVYADWLEDHGDPRADYLRTEVQWAKKPKASLEKKLHLLAEDLDPVWVARVSRLTRISLDSPRWLKFTTDGTPPSEVPRLLGEIQHRGEFGQAWEKLHGGPILHQGTVYTSTFAALPHLVALAAEQDPRTLWRFWILLDMQ